MAFFLFISIPAILLAEPTLSGANYWGDSNNAIIDSSDMGQLKQLLGGVAASYPTIEPNNLARSKYWQDINGSGVIDSSDLGILKQWLAGNYGDLTGNPALLQNETVTATVSAGDSIIIGARGKSKFNWDRAGWGVNFEIVGGNCVGATLHGRAVADGRNYIDGSEVYEYTGEPEDGGWARVKILVPENCSPGQSIVVNMHIPADSESGAAGDRFPTSLSINPISIMIRPGCGDGLCRAGESAVSCPQDCAGTCGDTVCNPYFENNSSCPADCLCGNGFCDSGEDPGNCPQDCPAEDGYEENDSYGQARDLGIICGLSPVTGCINGVAYDDDFFGFYSCMMVYGGMAYLSSDDSSGELDLCTGLHDPLECSGAPGNNESRELQLSWGGYSYVEVKLVSGSAVEYELCWSVLTTCGDGSCHERTEGGGLCPQDCP